MAQYSVVQCKNFRNNLEGLPPTLVKNSWPRRKGALGQYSVVQGKTFRNKLEGGSNYRGAHLGEELLAADRVRYSFCSTVFDLCSNSPAHLGEELLVAHGGLAGLGGGRHGRGGGGGHRLRHRGLAGDGGLLRGVGSPARSGQGQIAAWSLRGQQGQR